MSNLTIKKILQMAVISKDKKIKADPDPEMRDYFIAVSFLDEPNNEFYQAATIVGQTRVREFVIENKDRLDFSDSYIHAYHLPMYDVNAFIPLAQFMSYLDTITDTEGNKWFQDDFVMEDFLNSQVEMADISREERENYENAITMMSDRKMVDINVAEEGEDI